MTTRTKKAPDTSFLRDEIIKVQFIPKPTKEITDPRHVAYGRKLEGTYDYIAPPRLRKDKMKNILTDEEKEGLEYLMRRSLSIYDTEDNFWKGYKKGSLFPIALSKSDKILNLSIPEDYIVYKVLLHTAIVANSIEQMANEPRASYRYVLVKEHETEEAEAKGIDDKADAYEFYAKISKDNDAMRYVLGKLGKHTHRNQDSTFLRKALGNAIDNQKERNIILGLAQDKYFDIKVLLERAFALGVVDRVSGLYYTKEDEPIAGEGDEPNIDNAAKFLAKPLGQDMRLAIEARIKNTKE